MNALEKNVAVARGEALAASLLASAALQTALLLVPSNRDRLLTQITETVDDMLNRAGPGKGDSHDEPNTLMRETARFQVMQHLDAIKRILQDVAPSGTT